MICDPIITGTWLIAEIVKQFPEAAEVFTEYNLHCISCAIGGVETLEEGCRVHGMSDNDITLFIDDLNDVIHDSLAERSQELIVTKEAALAIREHAKKEGTEDNGLSVQQHDDGGFSLEYQSKPEDDELEFFHEGVPDVKVWASQSALQRIGGATINIQDGEFLLEMGG